MTHDNPRMGDLNELVERVKATTGPDRALDEAIRQAIDKKMTEPQLRWRETFPYTASIDAALALTERMLGDNWYSIMLDAIRELGASGTEPPAALPRYILAALLTALSLDTNKGDGV